MVSRRGFFAGALAVGAASTFASECGRGVRTPAAGCGRQKGALNLSLQWWTIPGKEIAAKLDYLESHGYAGVEIPADNAWIRENIASLGKALAGRTLRLGPACGWSDLAMASREKRDAEVARLGEIIDAIGPLKSAGLIVCPARDKPELSAPDLRRDFVENTGRRLAARAAKAGTKILLEPLRRNETPFLRQVPDGAKMAQEIGAGAQVMADIWHMAGEESDLYGAMLCARGWLGHVHIASLRNRRIPGLDGAADDYVEAFRGLQAIGYEGLVSLEGGFPKNAAGKWMKADEPEATVLLDKMCVFLREQWARAADFQG